MSAGLRDHRIAVYALAQTFDRGITSKAFARVDTYWGRIEPPTGREVTTGWAPDHQVDGVAYLANDAAVAPTDVLVDEAGTVWEVRAVLPRRRLADVQCLVQRGDQAVGSYLLEAS